LSGTSMMDRSLNEHVDVRHSTWLPWRHRNLWRTLKGSLLRHPNLTIRSDARVEALRRQGNRIVAADVVDSFRGRTAISARQFVLAAGTVDNVRLLSADGLPRSPLLGLGFMDHVSGRALKVPIVDRGLFARRSASLLVAGRRFSPRYLAPPGRYAEAGSPFAYGHWDVEAADGYALAQLRDSLRAIQVNGVRGAGSAAHNWRVPFRVAQSLLPGIARGRLELPPGDVYMRVDVEQLPRNGKILVADDARKSVRLDWGISARDRETFDWFGKHLRENFPWLEYGCGRPTQLVDPPLTDTKHLMGATRMSGDIDTGVVDRHGLVHGLDNLWVVGASVFPTGGVANPTVTASALALGTVATLLASGAR